MHGQAGDARVSAGQEDLAHGRATADHRYLCEPEHAAASGLPLHPHQLLHQAGRHQALLP